MIDQILGNWLCWIMFTLTLIVYQQLWIEYLDARTEDFYEKQTKAAIKDECSGILIGAIPLLGLLGTIIGLLDCFAGIADEGTSSELVSNGIANALLTTQLGLICAIPAWLLQAYTRSSVKKYAAKLPS
jgi:biopolymer transport protein ExbB